MVPSHSALYYLFIVYFVQRLQIKLGHSCVGGETDAPPPIITTSPLPGGVGDPPLDGKGTAGVGEGRRRGNVGCCCLK